MKTSMTQKNNGKAVHDALREKGTVFIPNRELSHEERKRVPSSELMKYLGEDTTNTDDKDKDYYPLSEAFDKMNEAERAKMSTDDKLAIVTETPQKRKK